MIRGHFASASGINAERDQKFESTSLQRRVHCEPDYLRDLATMRTVVQAVGKPLNVVMSAADPSLTAAEMEAIGVKRLSVGGALSRLALAAFMKGAREMKRCLGCFPSTRRGSRISGPVTSSKWIAPPATMSRC
jgi:Phosphoenolpyruvate phosphomutase